MSEAFDRMVRAMATADGCSGGELDRVREVYEPLARAAMEAIRQPTAAMIAAGWQASGVAAAFTSMIDEALKVEP